ncbi:MAG: phosphatidate cytidylyltransferase [Bacilli bacterium]|nr:phosphatidate cytidylyltransferase [Bacilli bacterium]
MKQRTISAIILLIIMIGSILIDSKLFGVLMLICSVIGYKEFFDVRYSEKNKKLNLIRLIGILSVLMTAMNNTFYKIDMNIVILVPLLLLSLPIIFYNDNKLYNITDALYNLGIVYFLGLSFGNIIYMADSSLVKCIFIFIIAFITDTYAYIGGMLIGKHKLTSISPKKTIEGSVIGTIIGTLVGSVYYYNLVGGVTKFEVIVLCLFLTILSELGDLFFSSIKRYFDKKDYSNLIPGHGGILDRFDSVIYVSLGLSLILSII